MQTNTFSWRNEPELMARLITAQNALRTPIDIMTFAGFCDSREALEAHVLRYEARMIEEEEEAAALKAARRAKRHKARGTRCANTCDLDAIMGW